MRIEGGFERGEACMDKKENHCVKSVTGEVLSIRLGDDLKEQNKKRCI